MFLRQIFDPVLAQYAYLIGCQKTGEALIVDPERDIGQYRELAARNGLKITAVTETHIHADFLSGAQEFAADPDVKLFLSGEGGEDWSYRWPEGRPNTKLLLDGDRFKVGNISVESVHTPGHTPEHMSFLITDQGTGAGEPVVLITGDFLFVGGVGRPDLLETAAGEEGNMLPSAETLRRSLVEKLSPYGDYLQVLPGHGAGSACGKSLGAIPTTTLGYERRFNPALRLALEDRGAFLSDILRGQVDPPLYFAAMKRANRDGCKVTGGIPEAKRAGLSDFQRLAKVRSVKLIDTRSSKDAFERSHYPKSIHAPLGTAFFVNAAGSFLDLDDPIILVVENESAFHEAVKALYRAGFDNVVSWITAAELESAELLTEVQPKIEFSAFDPSRISENEIIVDARNSGEYEAGHLAGARSIPYTRIKSHMNSLPGNARLYVHCASGKRASLATSFLRAEGYDAIQVDGRYPAK